MKQYLDLAQQVLNKGTYKPAARENMPATYSLFGAQFRHDLSEGFPLLTTKKVSFKNVVVELLWFMKGNCNIKYLIDNGCNIWNEDAYNYYRKILEKHDLRGKGYSFEEFILTLKEQGTVEIVGLDRSVYKIGDCGKQYGWLWRNWEYGVSQQGVNYNHYSTESIDQLTELIEGLKINPMSRRHIITAWNPTTLDDMALNACHSFVQFNCRPKIYSNVSKELIKYDLRPSEVESKLKELNLPKYYLDCQLYQRSADLMLGVPYNIASYSLLIHIISKITNMVSGEFIHTFGDVHIYDSHLDAIREQLTRTPTKLPTLVINEPVSGEWSLDNMFDEYGGIEISDFSLENYNPQSTIKAKLSTGLQ